MNTQATVAIDEVVDSHLIAETRAYIQSLEVCSQCDRVTPCRQLADGWLCLDRTGCVISKFRDTCGYGYRRRMGSGEGIDTSATKFLALNCPR